MVGPTRPQIVLFGSSIVQLSFGNGGWGANLADIYSRKADIVLRGYNGWNSRKALKVLDKVFPKDALVQPSLVIVYFGGNDSMKPNPSGVCAHVPLPEYVENMRKIATHLKELSDTTRLIFLGAPPINEALIAEHKSSSPLGLLFPEPLRTNELCGKYSEALIQLGKEMDFKVIDLWTAMQKRNDWLSACFIDGIHLTAEGSEILTEEILKVLKEANWEPSLHWKSMPTEFSEESCVDIVTSEGARTVKTDDWAFHWKKQWNDRSSLKNARLSLTNNPT